MILREPVGRPRDFDRESEPEEEIQPEDEVEIVNFEPDERRDPGFFENGDHGHVVRVDSRGVTIRLIVPRRPMPGVDNEHWVPRENIQLFRPQDHQREIKDN